MWKVYLRQHPTLGTWYQRIEAQPSWVTRLAAGLAVAVFVVPLLMLLLAAAVVGLVAFMIFGVIASLMAVARQVLAPPEPVDAHPPSAGEGRRNVRVIERP